ncbi:MAG: M28 family peptidase [Sphaerobacter sp.]|nr:M28 family peptidase [Sphaerobacter sp.]
MVVDPTDITTLATTIGPRPPGSAYERRAAGYVIERLQQLGVPATLLPVHVPRGFALVFVTIFAIAAVSVPLARLSEPLGLVLSLAALILAALEGTGRAVISGLAVTRNSHNVLGLIGPRPGADPEAPERLRRVVLTAHLDTGRSGLLSQQPLVAWLRPLALAVAAALVLIPLLQAVALATRSPLPWSLSLLPLVVLLGAIGLLLERELRGDPVAGANDNASGIATLLGVARALRRDPPRHVEVWLLCTAGAEAGMAGMRQFLSENRFDLDRTSFIVLDSVGAGRLRFSRGDGLLRLRRSSPTLLRIAGEIAREHPAWGLRPQARRLPATDQSVALALGYQAIGLFAAAEDGLIPNWHQPSDTPERLDLRTVGQAADVVLAMIRRLDDAARDAPPFPRVGTRPGARRRAAPR